MDEPAKRPGRTEFARDRARIIHSFALRRLAAKTQVATPWAQDFPRTRLSHSLECAQVGRELGAILGADPDLMEGACLAHDIGHPPFGHNGETALNRIAANAGGFEGNAQSFRLLTRIEAKTVLPDGTSVGLNLTRATLDASTKYPWTRNAGSKKFGVYEDDWEIFNWVRAGRSDHKTPIEAQIMDWSDDIAYSVHDLEDGIVTNKFSFNDFAHDLPEIYLSSREKYLSGFSLEEIEAALSRLQSLSCWPVSYDGSHRHLARLKDLTSQLIGRFAQSAETETRKYFSQESLTRYSAELKVPRDQLAEVALLKAMTAHYIIFHEDSQNRYMRQQELLEELVSAIVEIGKPAIDLFFVGDWERATTDNQRLR
jgi:dGTPase